MASNSARSRIESVDLLRGIIMILMALDHVRDFLGSQLVSPTDVAHAPPALFFTRWITHFCAPVFFMLTGTGAFLSLRRRTASNLSRFLLTRGMWLILLELTVVRCLGYQFNVDYRVTMLVILWALGWAMITLSALVRLPAAIVGVIGLVLVCIHNAFDGLKSADLGALGPVWSLLHVPGVVLATSRFFVFESYPIVPWIGVTAIGFALGQIYDWDFERRRAFLLRAGIVATIGFVLLRASNFYGDPRPWTHQDTAVRTVMSFFNANKYPPSLLYLLMTLGPALLLLRQLDGRTPRSLLPALTIGRVPLFYFLLHLPLIHAMAVAVSFARYGAVHWMFESPDISRYPFTAPPGWGLPLPAIYLAWLVVVVLLYPACRWYESVKRRSDNPWLSYL